jgi:hypothetical protein
VASLTCLYCPDEADSLEHPLPAAFGEFESADYLEDRVCARCNNARLGLLDEQLSRCGPEAFLRTFFSVTGRENHDAVNPYYRGSAGGRRLEMKAFDPVLKCEVALEYSNGQVRQRRELVFVESSSGKTHRLPIPDDLRDPEKLRAMYARLGVTQPAECRVVYDPQEDTWFEPLLKAAWPALSFGEGTLGATTYETPTIDVELTDRYFRGIAKVGFHYFLSQFPDLHGSEPCFEGIRRFIIEEGQPVTQANDFIAVREYPLVGEMMGGARPDGWMGHVLAADTSPGTYRAHVQLFVSKEWPAPTYTVQLSGNTNDPALRGSGHAYVYFSEGRKGRFSGKAHTLNVERIAIAQSPLKPVIATA